jgi:hypothetical protein
VDLRAAILRGNPLGIHRLEGPPPCDGEGGGSTARAALAVCNPLQGQAEGGDTTEQRGSGSQAQAGTARSSWPVGTHSWAL